MNFLKYKLLNGNGYITIQNKNNDSNKHCGDVKDIFITQIKIPFTNYAIALRKRNVSTFSDYGLERIKSLFGQYNYKVHKLEVVRINKSKDSQNDVFYISDDSACAFDELIKENAASYCIFNEDISEVKVNCEKYGMLFPIHTELKKDWKFTDIYMNIALD